MRSGFDATSELLTSRRVVLGAMGVAAASASVGTRAAADEGEVVLHVYRDGALLDYEGFREVQSNGAGEDGMDDVLLNADTLTVAQGSPLYSADGATVRLGLPGSGPYTLSLSWSTSHGYSAIMADLPGPGTFDLHELAAKSLHRRQESRLGGASDRVKSARAATQAELDRCAAFRVGAEKGRSAQRCLELATTAQLLLDREAASTAPPEALIGVTFTRVPSTTEVNRLRQLAGSGRRPAVRIVLDDLGEIDAWADAVGAIQDTGSLVVGQVCDSFLIGKLSDEEWGSRLDTVFTRLASVDVWEVGNELGGNWLGDKAVERVTQAARRARSASRPTLLTLYYQLGQDEPRYSTFTWAKANLTPGLMELVDVVGLSIYPQHHPLGSGADRVLAALAAAFPGHAIAVTEAGYGAEDLNDGPWWFGSADDIHAARREVARHITSVGLGRARCWGAPFWWYFLEDEAEPGGAVGDILAEVAAE